MRATSNIWNLQEFGQLLRRYAGLLIGVSLLVLVGWQLWQAEQWDAWWQHIQLTWQEGSGRWWLLTAILLMPLNWLLETIKWRSILQVFQSTSFRDCWRSVLAGISVSLATPNRIGEYGGRLLVRPVNETRVVVLSTLVGSLSQWLVFLFIGWPALIYYLGMEWQWQASSSWILALIGPAIVLIGLLAWPIRIELDFLMRSRYGRWLRLQLQPLRQIKRKHLLVATNWALCRYLVYVLQYYCLLQFFGLNLPLWLGLSGISAIFFIQAGIPLPPAWGVVTRAELALLMWGAIATHPIVLVGASLSLFVINLVVPALLGTWWIVKMNDTNVVGRPSESIVPATQNPD